MTGNSSERPRAVLAVPSFIDEDRTGSDYVLATGAAAIFGSAQGSVAPVAMETWRSHWVQIRRRHPIKALLLVVVL